MLATQNRREHHEKNNHAHRTVVGRGRDWWGTRLCASGQRRCRQRWRRERCSWPWRAFALRERSLSIRAIRHLCPRRPSALRPLHKEPRRRRRPGFLTRYWELLTPATTPAPPAGLEQATLRL